MKELIFYVNNEKIAEVSVRPSQIDRFETLIRRLCTYAAKFGYNVQYDVKNDKKGDKEN